MDTLNDARTLTEKYCSSCKQIKPVSEFYKRRDRPNGYVSKCKQCRNAYRASYIKTPQGQRSQNASNRQWWLTYGKDFYKTERGKQCRKRALKKYNSSEHGQRKNRDRHLRVKYGITLEQYEQMFESQGRVCAICGSDGNGRKFHLDHSHKDGKIRAILCHTCNSGLGLFQDDPERFKAAMEYLLKHS